MSDDLTQLAAETAQDARSYLRTVTTVASGPIPSIGLMAPPSTW